MARIIEIEIGCCGECPYYSMKKHKCGLAQLMRVSREIVFTGTALCPGMRFLKTGI